MKTNLDFLMMMAQVARQWSDDERETCHRKYAKAVEFDERPELPGRLFESVTEDEQQVRWELLFHFRWLAGPRHNGEPIETVTDEELQYWNKAISRARIEPHQALACRVALGFVEATRSGETPTALMYKMLAQCGIKRCNEEANK